MKLLMQQRHGNNPEFTGQAIWCFVWALMLMLSSPTWLCILVSSSLQLPSTSLGRTFPWWNVWKHALGVAGKDADTVGGGVFTCVPLVIGVLALSTAC